jgi:hypothetical protein
MAAMGHQDQFTPPSLSGRRRLGKATFAGIGGKEEDAPIPAVRLPTIGRPKPTQSGSSTRISSGAGTGHCPLLIL